MYSIHYSPDLSVWRITECGTGRARVLTGREKISVILRRSMAIEKARRQLVDYVDGFNCALPSAPVTSRERRVVYRKLLAAARRELLGIVE